ncbi:MAG: energy-coupling factor transporter transmembrane protein EcfT [Clostridiales bacterium]|jgi:energy-coupling factor transport system permease protein|nr:energy-coupling factor transporter transmembrane protein EcfT [Clostridiales bacterium]
MLKVTIGQYYPAESFIHRLDPRMKLLCTLLFIVFIFFITNFLGYIAAAIYLALIVRTSTVPPRFLLRGLRAIFFIIIFTAVLNIFFTAGETIVLQLGGFRITQEGLLNAGRMALRLIMLIIGSSILTLTTTPIQLTDAIEYALKPLKKIRVPAHEIAMMMTIALRFIPTLMEEMDKIMKAQMARGADFDTGGLIKKARSLVPLLVPLFISAFRRAEDLALAMESRCYRGDVGRTRMKKMKMAGRDYAALGVLLLLIAAIFALNYVAGVFGIW